MAGEQLNNLIYSLQEKDILDDYFDELNEKGPDFVTKSITTFLKEAGATLEELRINLFEPAKVNYPRVNLLADRLKESSTSIGGSKLADACFELGSASMSDSNKCPRLFGAVTREYSTLQESLNQIVELERAINLVKNNE